LAIEDGFNSQHRSFFHGYIKIPELDFSFFSKQICFFSRSNNRHVLISSISKQHILPLSTVKKSVLSRWQESVQRFGDRTFTIFEHRRLSFQELSKMTDFGETTMGFLGP